jgi:hypothetical protein
MSNYGNQNELDFIDIISDKINKGISNFVFKGKNGSTKLYKNICSVDKVKKITNRKAHGVCNKGDIILNSSDGHSYPISLKMSDCKTSWESADYSLKYLLYDFVNCYGKMYIPHGYKIRIDHHEEDLEKYVFGNDILTLNGSIVVQTIKNSKVYDYNISTCVFTCSRVFKDFNEVNSDKKYKPVIAIKYDSSRNKYDKKISGLRVEVVPYHVATSMDDILDINNKY